MPHCIIEHSASLKGEELLSPVFQGVLNSGLFTADGSDIKVRGLPYSVYQTGNTNADFVHVTVRILAGRTDAEKQRLSAGVLATINALKLVDCSVTIEVVDIDRQSYSKTVS
ncbi:5-carboxymethyl-2-hydroxymuconate Delta-isomerase [Amphritea sp. 2_MG-2023]|uniref:5-carboxymethyl-2-hydroxymuconate Delta-isomerase n=1 Tax=Amphritea TaxID=515417 RepID=UPI001C069ABC|nr:MULTISPECIES: 5-carboxymethyl-2-hydroxymuconate Delta-isomerase [Amphritea]MBU2966801.1 5-carboxymethyl-2-hydroxymuconate Delta-isomerase [Amphritea atlantica]MDO6420668.1 5-carboxymethyl-2-hydroxymuconate Delta-isomerase [Amphritea sp. 2_MG-2023]